MLNLYSERNQDKEEDIIFQYDKIPKKFKNQIIFILEDLFLILNDEIYADDFYYFIHRILCKEWGKEKLFKLPIGNNDKKSIEEFIKDKKTPLEEIFDLIEYSLLYTQKRLDDRYRYINGSYDNLNHVINEINHRFKESKLGYEIVNLKIIRIDSQYTHSNIIKPTINLTTNEEYKQVNLEYMEAITCYQDDDYEHSIEKATEAFESTLKIICDNNNWKYQNKDGYERLVDICYENHFLDDFIVNEFTSLRGILKSMSAVRNKFTSHGKGNFNQDIPTYLVKHALNITGSCILFLIESQDS